ncbi:hypothetical protein [Cryobacterium psychrophilum]|uniref:Uncharacterized protein n=1 Tax=Cryobacterium psychrophilum TaxID=41988 RepID=A0A4Y8KS89_9MICO|nr:hypothetical protein E3T53_04200 [Cryobacterium psychrophilum]
MTKEILLQFAKDSGVPDMTRFASDLTNPGLLERVNADLKEANSIGATGTPCSSSTARPCPERNPSTSSAR